MKRKEKSEESTRTIKKHKNVERLCPDKKDMEQWIFFFLLLLFFKLYLHKNIYLRSKWVFQKNTKDTILSIPTERLRCLIKRAKGAPVWPRRKMLQLKMEVLHLLRGLRFSTGFCIFSTPYSFITCRIWYVCIISFDF